MLFLEDYGLLLLRGEIAVGFVVLGLEFVVAGEAVLYSVSEVGECL